jgi:acyl carrier protein
MGLDTVEFVLWAEDHFGIDIPDDHAAGIFTVGQFCRYVENRLTEKGNGQAPSYHAILTQVTERLVSEYNVASELITEDARFVKDLGLE